MHLAVVYARRKLIIILLVLSRALCTYVLLSTCSCAVLRLSALMDLYIHPLYVLLSKILSSILNSSAPIYPLYHPLSTLSTVRPTYHFI
jgi:hypothetical protein